MGEGVDLRKQGLYLFFGVESMNEAMCNWYMPLDRHILNGKFLADVL